MRKQNIPIILMIVCCLYLQCSFLSKPHKKTAETKVLIIKAAGYPEGQQPQGPDAITEATSVGRNVNVVSQALANELEKHEIRTRIINFNEVNQLNAQIFKSVDLIIFAGPAYSSRFPKQLQDVVPVLKDVIIHQNILCTSMTTCRFLDSGGVTVRTFNEQLKEQGIQTIDGLVVHHEYEDKKWDEKVEQFATLIENHIKK